MALKNNAALLLFSSKNLSKSYSNRMNPQYAQDQLLGNVQKTDTDAAHFGPLFPARTSRGAAYPDVAEALFMLTSEDAAVKDSFAVLRIGKNHYASEIKLDDGSTRVTMISFENGIFQSADIVQSIRPDGTQANRTAQSEQLSSNREYDTRGVMLCCLQYIFDNMSGDPGMEGITDGPFSEDTVLGMLKDYQNTGLVDATRIRDLLIGMTYTIMYGIENGNIKLTIPANGTPTMLTDGALDSITGTTLHGSPRIIKLPGGIVERGTTLGAAKQEFAKFASAHQWTPEEQAMIPVLPDDMEVPPEAMKIARRFVSTWEDRRPMKNFYWRGVTSYGKTTGVEAIAAMLGIPYTFMTCSSTMETSDFLSSFVPDTQPASDIPALDYESIAFDPEGAYEDLTGKFVEAITPTAVFEEYIRRLKEAKSSDGGFRRIESNYVKGLQRGWLVEIQEASRIKDGGVLVGLNGYDKPGARIPMVDGSFVSRSEDALLIFTDNIGYDSCHPVDPSVLRRFAFIIDSLDLSEEMVMNRLAFNTGCTNEGLMGRLYDIWLQIQQYCRDNEITDGTVSVTELEMWLRLVMLDGENSIRSNCQDAVISKATSDPNEQAAIMASIETML